ncbi:S-adenosyl-L-methionine-dependent methyltransferase, partial [Leptodontidium sp. 2 PMI_412]
MSREAVQGVHEAMHTPENASSLPKGETSEVTRQIDQDRPHDISEPLNDSLAKITLEKNDSEEKLKTSPPSETSKSVLKGDQPTPTPTPDQVQPESYEEQHVHQVYEQIASHFSSTRYKPWPIVESFLQSLAPGSIGLDIGCGNGKYLAVNKDIFIIGSDRSSNLVKIARHHEPHAAVVADSLSLPHQDGRFDFAICIAVVHHLSTRERRKEAVESIL